MTDKIPAEVTFVFRDNSSLKIRTNSIKGSASAYHIGNLIFPGKFIYDVTVKDPDNLLGLTG